MITAEDLIHLPYTPDLTSAGVLQARRSLALGLVQADNLHIAPLRRLVTAVAAELALRRHLTEAGMPFKTLQTTPFTQSDWGDVVLGGRRCHLVEILYSRRSILRHIKDQHSSILQTPACLPDVYLTSELLEHHDLLVFTIILAKPQPSWHEIRRCPEKIIPCHFAYILPKAWKNPAPGRVYGQIYLTNEGESEFVIELGGRGVSGQYQSEILCLPAHRSVKVAQNYTALAYLSTETIPAVQLSISRAEPDRTLRVPAHRWVNLWLNGVVIILAGYMTVGDFHSKARRLSPTDRTWNDLPVQTPAKFLHISELHSLPQFFAWINSNA